MSVVRIVHNKENPYVLINKKALWDENLSLEAVGLWARLLSRPDDWNVNVKELVSSCQVGKRIIYRCLNQLIEAGYAIRHQPWKKIGTRVARAKVEYFIFEFKISEEFKKSFLLSTFEEAHFEEAQNCNALLNKDSLPSTKENNILCASASSGPPKRPPKPKPAEKKERAKNVYTTDMEHEELLKKFGSEEKLHKSYSEYAIWKDSKGISRKSDFRTLKNWSLSDSGDSSYRSSANSPENQPQKANNSLSNADWLRQNKDFNDLLNQGKMALGDGYVMSRYLEGKVYLDHPAFKEILINMIRKLMPPAVIKPLEM